LGETGVDERQYKINLAGRRYGEINWIHLAQNKIKWQALVNTAMNHQPP
jgi:hypothetical protein